MNSIHPLCGWDQHRSAPHCPLHNCIRPVALLIHIPTYWGADGRGFFAFFDRDVAAGPHLDWQSSSQRYPIWWRTLSPPLAMVLDARAPALGLQKTSVQPRYKQRRLHVGGANCSPTCFLGFYSIFWCLVFLSF